MRHDVSNLAGILLIALGAVGQACFFARFFVQWWCSERAGASVAPRAFWYLSLVGAAVMSVYAFINGDAVLLPGFVVGLGIYARNLVLVSRPVGTRGAMPSRLVLLLALLATAILLASGAFQPRDGLVAGWGWLAVGVLGQTLWSSRFVLQWWASERAGHSHFPPIFWWLSLVANFMLLAYALHIRDAIYVAGFLPGPLVQVRNLWLQRGLRPKLDGLPAAPVE